VNDFCPDGEIKEEPMPRKKKSKLTRILEAIEKTLADHANQIVHEDNKKKRARRKKETVKKDRPIDF